MNKLISSPLIRQATCFGLNKITSNTAPLAVVNVVSNSVLFGFHHGQVRFAGHSKWQNIKATKGKNDLAKGRNTANFVQQVRKAVLDGGSGDPKLNRQLGDIIAQAGKNNIAKATLDRAIKRALDTKITADVVEVMGPGGCFVIVEVETDDLTRTRYDIKTIAKKAKDSKGNPSMMMRTGQAKHAFTERGSVKIAKKSKDGSEINFEKAEEIAIEAGAEEVVQVDPAESDVQEDFWTLVTDPKDVYMVKGYIEKNLTDVEVVEFEVTYEPKKTVEISDADVEKAAAMLDAFQELEEVTKVHVNIA